jgi:hypothetical protein
LIVGPTCTSLICAIENPCSSAGRFATGTSTSTTAARRRALNRPISVARTASASVAIAVSRSKASSCGGLMKALVISSTMSRSSVNTSSEENSPIVVRPIHASRSDHSSSRAPRATTASGIIRHDASNASQPTTAPVVPNGKGGSKRKPM